MNAQQMKQNQMNKRTEAMKTVFKTLIAVVVYTTTFAGSIGQATASIITINPANSIVQDGDFEGQPGDGSFIGAPWTAFMVPGSNIANSPFTNVFANNSRGVNSQAGGTNGNGSEYFIGGFSGSIPNSSTAQFVYNVDVKANIDQLQTGSWGFVLGSDGANTVFTLRLSGADLTVKSGGTDQVFALDAEPAGSAGYTKYGGSDWYNIQLIGDMATKTFSGTLTPFSNQGNAVSIASRSFTTPSTAISYLHRNTSLASPNMFVDNFAVALLPVPEPHSLALLGLAGLALWRSRRGKAVA